MGNKLYVGNLAFETTEDELNQLFSEYGSITSARVIQDRETQRSRGFGFVEFENESDAEAAQKALDQQDFAGRTLRVNEAQEQKPRRSSEQY